MDRGLRAPLLAIAAIVLIGAGPVAGSDAEKALACDPFSTSCAADLFVRSIDLTSVSVSDGAITGIDTNTFEQVTAKVSPMALFFAFPTVSNRSARRWNRLVAAQQRGAAVSFHAFLAQASSFSAAGVRMDVAVDSAGVVLAVRPAF